MRLIKQSWVEHRFCSRAQTLARVMKQAGIGERPSSSSRGVAVVDGSPDAAGEDTNRGARISSAGNSGRGPASQPEAAVEAV